MRSGPVPSLRYPKQELNSEIIMNIHPDNTAIPKMKYIRQSPSELCVTVWFLPYFASLVRGQLQYT